MNTWIYDFRIAFKRLKRQYSQDSEEFMLALAFLVQLSDFHSKNACRNTFECLKSFYNRTFDELNTKLDKNLKGAKDFVVASNFSQEESNEWLKKVEIQNATSIKQFIKQNKINFKLFDCIINDSNNLIYDNNYVKKLVSELSSDKLNIYPIEKIEVINAIGKGIGSFQNQYLNGNLYDILTNGTYFTDNAQITWEPCGTIITNKKVFESNRDKVIKRGGLILLNSGIINIGTAESNKVSVIKETLKEDLNLSDLVLPELKDVDEVAEFLGGGAVLIKSGKSTSGSDLYSIQKFDQFVIKYDKDGNPLPPTNNGFDSMQLSGERIRIFIAKYNEIPFLLKVKDSARNVQKELQIRGFSDLICFDGGGGLYFNKNGNVEHLVGRDSPSGLAIKVKQYEE